MPNKDKYMSDALTPSWGRPPKKVQFPLEDPVQMNGFGHFPSYEKNWQRCKFPPCKEHFSYIMCAKCEVTLCLNKKRNCFLDYHV